MLTGNPSAVLTLGLGSWGSTGLVLSLGLGASAVVVGDPKAPGCGTLDSRQYQATMTPQQYGATFTPQQYQATMRRRDR